MVRTLIYISWLAERCLAFLVTVSPRLLFSLSLLSLPPSVANCRRRKWGESSQKHRERVKARKEGKNGFGLFKEGRNDETVFVPVTTRFLWLLHTIPDRPTLFGFSLSSSNICLLRLNCKLMLYFCFLPLNYPSNSLPLLLVDKWCYSNSWLFVPWRHSRTPKWHH